MNLKPTDGPFIDENFYGSKIASYIEELNAIGVCVDVKKACSLLARHIYSLSEFSPICRIYSFLRESNWEPGMDVEKRIWVPCGVNNGEWVKPEDCVIHDKDGLFSFQLKVLEKYYDDRKLLVYLSSAFNVKSNPTVDDYCMIWKDWESHSEKLTHAECCAFWSCVGKHWGQHTQEKITETVMKLPVESSGSEIVLLAKGSVFIADDLQLKDLFSHHSIFVWYPEPSLPYLPRTKLIEIYKKMGVLKLSESVQKEELSLEGDQYLKQAHPSNHLIGKELVRLILGLFSDPSFEMERKKRHEAVQSLLNLTILEALEPITVKYTLSGYSGKSINAEASQMIHWDKASSKLFTQKIDKTSGQKSLLEYATCFSETIAKGLLWEKEDRVNELSELIKLACLLEFDKEAIGFLMKSMNLQVFKDDEDFLSSAFPYE
ncbi:hypothetical protein ACFE04_011745 [Oxalis oulophora]